MRKISGFLQKNIQDIWELNATLHHMIHEKTGLELVWLQREDENKTFGIAFTTLPQDDTGVFHILEHSVLCGSEKYPVKEPFVELMKSSLKTFLNAMTFPDKTFYPVSTRNEQDFINLMRVYLDAVFCPAIYQKPEIFWQEGWHYEFDEDQTPSYKGVVFNEMKGAFAGANQILRTQMQRALFPDTPYQFVSGGDPEAIPQLTYEMFLECHRKYYSPSNAYIFLDGTIDIEKVLLLLDEEYLCHYTKTEHLKPAAIQKAVANSVTAAYALPVNESLEGKHRLALGYVIGTFADRKQLLAAEILAEVLCGNESAPLANAIISAGLASSVSMRINDSILQPWMQLDLQNLKEETIVEAEQLVEVTLHKLVEEGLERRQLEAVMTNFEFKLRERDYGNYPQGLILGFQVLDSWLYGGDPANNLEIGDLFSELRAELQAGYFEKLITRIILENPHRARVVLHPSHTLTQQKMEEEHKRLQKQKLSWTNTELNCMKQQQLKLQSWQGMQDSAEQLAMIPKLALQDLPQKPEKIQWEELCVHGIQTLIYPHNTGGIAYVNLYFDANSCTEESLSYLSFICCLLEDVKTEQYTAQEITNLKNLLCGDLHIYPTVFAPESDNAQTDIRLCISFSALKGNVKAVLDLLTELLTNYVLEEDRMKTLLRQSKLEMFQQMVMAGTNVGLGRVAAQVSASAVAQEHIGGLCFYQWLMRLEENWNFQAAQTKMCGLLSQLVQKTGMVVSISGMTESEAEDMIAQLCDTLPEKPLSPRVAYQPWGIKKEGIVIPADISFAVAGAHIKQTQEHFDGTMQLAGQIISLGYLWNAVRVQGGAYGAGMAARNDGTILCYSYRDPNGAESIQKFRNCGAFLEQFANSATDYTNFIIGTIANQSPLLTPKSRAKAGDQQYFCKSTWEAQCKRRSQLLHTTPQDLAAVAEVLEQCLPFGGVCIVGNRKQLEQCNELDEVIEL